MVSRGWLDGIADLEFICLICKTSFWDNCKMYLMVRMVFGLVVSSGAGLVDRRGPFMSNILKVTTRRRRLLPSVWNRP